MKDPNGENSPARSRCTNKQYHEFLSRILSILQGNENGMTMNEIIRDLELEKNLPGRKTADETRQAAVEFVNRLFKSLKQYGCDCHYDKKRNRYELKDKNWAFPLEMKLSHVDQLALKLGWELLQSSVDSQKKGGLETLWEGTLDTLKSEPLSALKKKMEKDDSSSIIGLASKYKPSDENVFLNILSGWMKNRAVVLKRKDADPILIVPTQLQLTETGWLVRGKLSYGESNGQSIEIEISKISSAFIVPIFN